MYRDHPRTAATLTISICTLSLALRLISPFLLIFSIFCFSWYFWCTFWTFYFSVLLVREFSLCCFLVGNFGAKISLTGKQTNFIRFFIQEIFGRSAVDECRSKVLVFTDVSSTGDEFGKGYLFGSEVSEMLHLKQYWREEMRNVNSVLKTLEAILEISAFEDVLLFTSSLLFLFPVRAREKNLHCAVFWKIQ